MHFSRAFQITVGRSAGVASALMERSDLQYQERRSGDVMGWRLMLSCSTLALASEGGRMMNGRMMFVTQRVNEV